MDLFTKFGLTELALAGVGALTAYIFGCVIWQIVYYRVHHRP